VCAKFRVTGSAELPDDFQGSSFLQLDRCKGAALPLPKRLRAGRHRVAAKTTLACSPVILLLLTEWLRYFKENAEGLSARELIDPQIAPQCCFDRVRMASEA
jgi:hypothetical protein